jgi:hypothetical protein
MREQEIILADDMSEQPVTPEREQEIAALVSKVPNFVHGNKLKLSPEASLALDAELHAELERRKAIYRALMIGYTVNEKFGNIPKADPVKPNPNKQKPQPQLSPEEQRRYARIKKDLRKR